MDLINEPVRICKKEVANVVHLEDIPKLAEQDLNELSNWTYWADYRLITYKKTVVVVVDVKDVEDIC